LRGEKMNRKVISYKNLPGKVPLTDGILAYLLLDKFHAVPWIWGAVGTLWGILFIASVVGIWTQKDVDIFEEKK
jgi:hypothetical protein